MAFHGINEKCSLRFEDWNKKAALCPAGTNYHCLRNDLGTYGEICEPSFWIQTNYCLEYNTKSQKIALELCKGRHGCPSTDYLSDTVYQYSACFHDNNTAIDSSTTLRSTTKAESDPGFPPWAVAMSIVLPLGICIVILALVTTFLVMRSRRRNKSRVNQDEEEPMLPDEKDPEPEIQKHDEDNTFYNGIEAVAEGWKKLTQYGVVILVGVTGAGKTKCGLELLSMVRKVNTDACRIFNTKTQKMGARLCDSRQPDCQIFHDYRSSRAYEYKACISAKEDTKTIAQSTTTEVQTNNIQSSDVTSFVNTPVGIILLVFLIAMLVAANLLGIYFYRRKWRRRNGRFDRAAEYEPDKEKQEETDRLMAPNPCLAPEYEPDKEKQEEMDRLMAPNPCLAAEYEPDKEKQEETDRLMAPNPCLEIQRHRDDKTFYSGTRAAEKGWKVLTNYGVLIVVGLPGAGKTRLGLEMGFNFYGSMINGKYGVCKLAKDLKNLEQEIESDYHTCFFLDDCFETWNYTQTEYESTRNNEIDRLTLIYENHIKKKQVSIILTVDLSTWNKVHRLFMAYTLFDKDHILLVQYTNAEKKEILQRHSTASGLVIGDKSDGSLPEYTNITTKPGSEYITRGKVGKQNQKENTDITEETYDYIISEGTNIASIPDKDVEEILKAESKELGFPEACTLFCHDKALWQKGSKFFEKPMQYLKGRFEGMLGSREAVDKARICTLFYTLLSGGDLYVNNFNKKLVDEIGKLCQLDIFSADLIKKTAHDLSGSYLIEIFQDNFVLQHHVTEFVLLSLLHEKNAEMLLRHCPTRVLQRYVRASTYKKFESEMVLIIKPKHTESLAKRLADDSFSDGDCSIYMMDKDFTKYWGKAKKDRPAEAETEC